MNSGNGAGEEREATPEGIARSAGESCWCCGSAATLREPDPWEGRLDGYCTPCAQARCDTTDSVCPVKFNRQMVRTQFWIHGKVVVLDHPAEMSQDEWDRFLAVLEICKPGMIQQPLPASATAEERLTEPGFAAEQDAQACLGGRHAEPVSAPVSPGSVSPSSATSACLSGRPPKDPA